MLTARELLERLQSLPEETLREPVMIWDRDSGSWKVIDSMEIDGGSFCIEIKE